MRNAAASRLVKGNYNEDAVRITAEELLSEIGGKVTCGFAFVSPEYQPFIGDFLELVQLHGHVPTLIGCSGSGLIATAKEAEGSPGFSLLFLHLPETTLHIASFTQGELQSLDGAEAWHDATGVRPCDVDGWIALADPSTTPIEPWLTDWNAAYPKVPTIGGLASGGSSGEEMFVYRDRELVESVVALGFKGGVRIQTVVSQGCRPIGEALPVTGADRNIVTTLGSRPAYERLVETIEALSPLEKGLAAEGNLFAGLAMSEYIDEFKTGDFLVRNILAADPESGAVAIGALPRVGQTLEFQLRDRHSAHEELQRLLLAKRRQAVKPFASLVFSCTGRGRYLFGESDHDAGALADYFGHHPSAGFFCNGEIGPVGGRNFVHGYTASMALLVDA
jgi:small ligand-binding sensory domain FIST